MWCRPPACIEVHRTALSPSNPAPCRRDARTTINGRCGRGDRGTSGAPVNPARKPNAMLQRRAFRRVRCKLLFGLFSPRGRNRYRHRNRFPPRSSSRPGPRGLCSRVERVSSAWLRCGRAPPWPRHSPPPTEHRKPPGHLGSHRTPTRIPERSRSTGAGRRPSPCRCLQRYSEGSPAEARSSCSFAARCPLSRSQSRYAQPTYSIAAR